MIIVDDKKLSNITLNQLADYISMVVLTSPKMGKDYSDSNSIMSIFTARDGREKGPLELTYQDKAVLEGFYRFRKFDSPDNQVSAVAHAVEKGAKAEAEADPLTQGWRPSPYQATSFCASM